MAQGRPVTRASETGTAEALEPTDPRDGQDQGTDAVGVARGGRWTDTGGGQVGRAARDCGARGNAAGLAPGEGGDTLPAAETPASGLAGAEGISG